MPTEALAAALCPQWDAPQQVGALMSTRAGGVSLPPWDSLNLGDAVGDQAAAVAENRRRFAAAIGAQPIWLRQVHGSRVVRASAALVGDEAPQADAAWTDEPGVACVVQVADCLPLLLAAPDGRAVAAAHAGWRGLAEGVVEAALAALCAGAGCDAADVAAWLGPCIGPQRFEVGADVLQAFGESPPHADARRFVASAASGGAPRWLANLPQLARERLRHAGVNRIAGGEHCTVTDRARFFSYRRDGRTGRLAAAVWIRQP
jgi:YfiH family protein